MSTHVIQVRDLVTDLLRYRQEAPVVFVVGSTELNFDKSCKTERGVVELNGLDSDRLRDLEEDMGALEDLEGRGLLLLEQFDKIMSGEVADNPNDYNKALDALHEKVTRHLKER